MTSNPENLASACEAASGPDAALDKQIAKAVFFDGDGYATGNPKWQFTASIDAALTLVPEGWLVNEMFERNASGEWNWRWKVSLWQTATDASVTGIARSAHDKPCAPALALCAAALRAIHQEQGK